MSKNLFKDIFKKNKALINEVRQGLEKECLRMSTSGLASEKPHFTSLGSKLTHSKITTDYAENLLEFITPVHHETFSLLKDLEMSHSFVQDNIDDELLCPGSMPCELGDEDSIKIANYGSSNTGKLKSLYREGLGFRYGKSMQSIAGIHYNFSLSDKFWNHAHDLEASNLSLKEFKNEKYFALIRNFRRYSWALMYLYGASPVVEKSFLNNKKHNLKDLGHGNIGSEFGTSLRMGGLGYTSSAQEKISICYNQVETYIKTLEAARCESVPEYERIGLKSEDGKQYKQLNTNLLQIDNEFYSTVRPKNIAKPHESALMALAKRGVEYIEIRLLDLNPFMPLGIDEQQVHFLQAFLLWCLTEESADIHSEDCIEITSNFDQVVLFGRKEDLMLKKDKVDIPLKEFLSEVFSSLENFSHDLPSKYQKAILNEKQKISDISKLPSSELYREAQDKSLIEIYTSLGIRNKNLLIEQAYNKEEFQNMARQSLVDQSSLEESDKLSFDDFLVEYFEQIKIKGLD